MATVIPDKLYATIQHRKEGNEFPTRLGFISPYEKNAAFRKRKESQDTWAYGRGTDFIIKEDEGVIHGTNGTKDVAEYFMTNAFPRIIKNEPATGFEIARSVRRSGWKGAGNVLWRIQDPRGFEVEIISENFASIVDCTTIVNGVIQEECVWGREGSVNVLLPTNSEPYKEATKQTTLVNNKISLKEVKIGDHVTLIDKSNKTGHRDGVYMGRMFAAHSVGIPVEGAGHSWSTPVADLVSNVADMHVFYDPVTKQPYAFKKPVVGAMVAKAVNSNTHAENLQTINDLLGNQDSVNGFPPSTVMVVAKITDINDIEVVLADASIEMNLNGRFKETQHSGAFYHHAELILLTKDEVTWYAANNAKNKTSGIHHGYDDKIATLVKIDKDRLINDRQFYLTHTVKTTKLPYYNSTVTSAILDTVIDKFDTSEYKAKSVWLKHGDLKARLIGMPSGPTSIADRY